MTCYVIWLICESTDLSIAVTFLDDTVEDVVEVLELTIWIKSVVDWYGIAWEVGNLNIAGYVNTNNQHVLSDNIWYQCKVNSAYSTPPTRPVHVKTKLNSVGSIQPHYNQYTKTICSHKLPIVYCYLLFYVNWKNKVT